jgi:phosphoribosylamine---glycine ligase
MRGKGVATRDGKIAEGQAHLTSGEYVLVVTGLGATVQAARKRVYRTVKEVKFPNKMFRDDIGEKLEVSLPALHKFGYAVNMNYA